MRGALLAALSIARAAAAAPHLEVVGCPSERGEWVAARGLPAVTTDGAQVAALYAPSDGMRGNPGWTLAVIATAGDRRVREDVLLSPDEADRPPCAQIRARVARANAFLDGQRWVPLRPLGVLGGTSPLGALDLAATAGGAVEIRDGARLLFRRKVPGWTGGWVRCEGGKSRCDGEGIAAACSWAPGPRSLAAVFLDAGRGVLLTDLTPAAPGGGDSCDGSRQLDAFRLPPKVVAATGLAGGAPGHSPAARPMPPPAVTMTGCPAPADPADFERWLEVRGLPAISADGETVASLVPGPQGIALTWIEQATAGDAQRAREPIYGAGEKLPCEALRARVERVRARLAGGRWRALRELPVVAPHETPLGALDLRVTDEAKLELAGAGRLTALATQAIATIDRLWYDAASGGCAVYEGDQLHALRLPAEAAAVTGLR